MSINLVELSVSHYFLARALAPTSAKDVKVVNTSDADIAAAFDTDDVQAVATWNPMLADIKSKPGSTEVFDSSKIPGEIMDMMVVNSETLKDNPALGKALTGAWFEIMALMSSDSAEGRAALEHMARPPAPISPATARSSPPPASSTPQGSPGVRHQPETAGDHGQGGELLLRPRPAGRRRQDAEAVGMSFAKGVVTGDKANVKLRFDPTYVQMAAEGSSDRRHGPVGWCQAQRG